MARPSKHDGVLYKRNESAIWWMRYRDKRGKRHFESTGCTDWQEANKKLRERLQARDENRLEVVRKGEQLLFNEWADFFLQNYSQPPLRAAKTHEANLVALKHLRPAFGTERLPAISPDGVEDYLRGRLRDHKHVRTVSGMKELGLVKATTVHQEFRVLRRIFSVAVRKKFCPVNPCTGVEFPTSLRGLFRPHYMTSAEQERIEFYAPEYLKNVIRLIAETGLRVYKELAPMRKDQVDLVNALVFIPDSKTPNGVAEIPLTDVASAAFESQMEVAGPGVYLFPSSKLANTFQGSFKKTWQTTLRKAGVPYFRIYDLRSTYATRLSAGGVADEWVTQLLRQGDAKVFKKYSQMQLQMKREALLKINRRASEPERRFDTGRPN